MCRRDRRRWSAQRCAQHPIELETDDVSFGAPSTFGRAIPTPALDGIEATGLRYANFHTTALCSPNAGSAVTRRNHHSVGFGVVSEQSTDVSGYNSIIPKDSATVGRILQEKGYRTRGSARSTIRRPTRRALDQWPIGGI